MKSSAGRGETGRFPVKDRNEHTPLHNALAFIQNKNYIILIIEENG